MVCITIIETKRNVKDEPRFLIFDIRFTHIVILFFRSNSSFVITLKNDESVEVKTEHTLYYYYRNREKSERRVA